MTGLVTKVLLAFVIGAGAYHGPLGHYNPGKFRRTAVVVRGLPEYGCYISSDHHKLGAIVLVRGENTGKYRWCMVGDVSAPEDVERHLTAGLFESDYYSAEVLCGSTKLANADCQVTVSR